MKCIILFVLAFTFINLGVLFHAPEFIIAGLFAAWRLHKIRHHVYLAPMKTSYTREM